MTNKNIDLELNETAMEQLARMYVKGCRTCSHYIQIIRSLEKKNNQLKDRITIDNQRLKDVSRITNGAHYEIKYEED